MKLFLQTGLFYLLLLLTTAQAQVNTSDKIQLMADALRARSAGDFVEAKAKLETLIRLAPEDENVQRLLSSVNEEIRRTQQGQESRFTPKPEPQPAVVAQPGATPATTPAAAVAPVASPEASGVENPELIAFAQEQQVIAELLLRGRAQYFAGDYDTARQTFSEVEARAPNNREAKYFQTEIARILQVTGALDRSKTKQQMLQEVTLGWQRPQVFDRDFNRADVQEDNSLLEKLDSIILQRVSFSGLPLSRVVDTLSELSADYDPEGLGVNMVLIDPDGTDPEVTITLRNLPLGRVLDFTTESVGYEYDVQADAIVVRMGQGAGSRLVTEFFPLSRSTIIRLTGVGAGSGAGLARTAPLDPFAPAPASTSSQGQANEEQALRNFLQRAGVGFDAVEGANLAIADAQLIVTQTPRNMEKVRNILRRYSEVKQVEIEARFIEVQQGDLEELGFDWSIAAGGDRQFDPTTGDPIIGADGRQVRLNRDTYGTEGRTLADAFTVSQATNQVEINQAASQGVDILGNVTGNFEGLNRVIPQGAPVLPTAIELANGVGNLASISGVIANADIGLVIRALERQTGSDLMSAPKVTVLSGKTAEISVGQELRYPESYGDIEAQVGRGDSSGGGSAGVAITAGTPQDFQMRNIGVDMQVTPTVEEDSSISLLLEPRVTEFEGFVEYGGTSVAIAGGTTVTVPSGFFQPIFSVRKVRTEVTIWDGATVVLGGLTREQAVSVSDKVPVLGDIPFLGRLFRSEGESAQKRNLLIFVTANLISPGGSPQRQDFRTVEPGALFQNPTIVTPGGAVNRGVENSNP